MNPYRSCVGWLLPLLLLGLAFSGPSAGETKAELPRHDQTFSSWLKDFSGRARKSGISEAAIRETFDGVKPLPDVTRLDRNQPEFKLTYREYLDRVIPSSRVEAARNRLRENDALLARIEEQFGVPRTTLVALWAVESDFGRKLGTYPVVPSLATLAWEGRRRDYFEKQLMEILRLIDARHVSAGEMKGSWAGAMGQLQFMPETLRAYWHDWNGNGHVDIWDDPAEALASAANYLSKIGWKPGEPWGMPVTLPDTLEASRANTSMTMAQWKAVGVLQMDGQDPAGSERRATLIIVEKNAFLVHSNYDRLRNWNQSHFFALAVCQLADRIALPP